MVTNTATFQEEHAFLVYKDRAKQKSRCCTPICKNRWALVFGGFGAVFFIMAFLMLLDYDDIQKCGLTSGCYFAGLSLSCIFFLLAPVVKYVYKYEGFVNANPIFFALRLVGISYGARCCCYGNKPQGTYTDIHGGKEKRVGENADYKDYCSKMANYRENASKNTGQDIKVLLYSLLNDIVGLLTIFVATFLTHVNSRFKIAVVTVDNPWVLWPIMFLKPLFAIGKMIWSFYDLRAKHGCSSTLKVIVMGGIVYSALLIAVYALAYGDSFTCEVCPQFFKNGTLCDY